MSYSNLDCARAHLDSPISQVKGNWRKRWQTSSIDSLLESAWCRQVETCTKIALLNCLEKDSQKRPHIVKIINMLNETETNNYEVINTIAFFYVRILL